MKGFKIIHTAICVLVVGSLFGQNLLDPSALADAVKAGNAMRISELLLQGADPDIPNAVGHTPLGIAVSAGRFDLVWQLLRTAADPDKPDADGYTPLIRSIKMGRSDLASLLLAGGANPNVIVDVGNEHRATSPLSISMDRGEFELVRRLLKAGADGLFLSSADAVNPLGFPLSSVPLNGRILRDISQIRNNADSPDWETEPWTLHRAARDGQWTQALHLLDLGLNPNAADSQGVTPLMSAALHGRYALVSLLLQRGADPLQADADGLNSLIYAIAGGHWPVFKLLWPNHSIRISPSDASMEKSPYYWALISGRSDLLVLLLKAGIPLPGPGTEGITIMMVAAWLCDAFAVRVLLHQVGDDAGAIDTVGRTALEWSAAAFDRDRRTGRETGRILRGQRNYHIARLLARRTKDPANVQPLVSPDVNPAVIESWSFGQNPALAEDWRDKHPSPVPLIPGDGDITLYRIFRDEEQTGPSSPVPIPIEI